MEKITPTFNAKHNAPPLPHITLFHHHLEYSTSYKSSPCSAPYGLPSRPQHSSVEHPSPQLRYLGQHSLQRSHLHPKFRSGSDEQALSEELWRHSLAVVGGR